MGLYWLYNAAVFFVLFSFVRQYRGNEGQMRELQDQLEAEQYFSVSCHLNVLLLLFITNIILSVMSVFPQTLYKTQVKELKEEIEERNRQVQETHKKVQDLSSERCVSNLEYVAKSEIIEKRKSFKSVFFLDTGTRFLHSWIWQWPRQNQSSLPELYRRSSTLSSIRRARRQARDTSRRLWKKMLLFHGWAWPVRPHPTTYIQFCSRRGCHFNSLISHRLKLCKKFFTARGIKQNSNQRCRKPQQREDWVKWQTSGPRTR